MPKVAELVGPTAGGGTGAEPCTPAVGRQGVAGTALEPRKVVVPGFPGESPHL